MLCQLSCMHDFTNDLTTQHPPPPSAVLCMECLKACPHRRAALAQLTSRVAASQPAWPF